MWILLKNVCSTNNWGVACDFVGAASNARTSWVCASPGGEVLAPPAESSRAIDVRVPATNNRASQATPLQKRASRVCASPGGQVLAPPAESSRATGVRVPAPDNRALPTTPLQNLATPFSRFGVRGSTADSYALSTSKPQTPSPELRTSNSKLTKACSTPAQ